MRRQAQRACGEAMGETRAAGSKASECSWHNATRSQRQRRHARRPHVELTFLRDR